MHFTGSSLTYFNHLYNDQFATNTIDIELKLYRDYFKRNRVSRNIVHTWCYDLWWLHAFYIKRCVCLSFTICTSQLITSYDLVFVFYCNKKAILQMICVWPLLLWFKLLVIFTSFFLYKIWIFIWIILASIFSAKIVRDISGCAHMLCSFPQIWLQPAKAETGDTTRAR